ncbi:MAG: transglutaminase domain-containing protein [Bacteroidales bacterium]
MKRLSYLLIAALLITLMPYLGQSYTGEISKKFKTPGKIPTGLTYDGENLWMADRKDKLLYAVNPSTGEVTGSIQSPAYWPMGLAWDGESLWNIDVKGGIPLSENYKGVVYQIDPEDGTVLHSVNVPASQPRGLTWDGEYLWCLDNGNNRVIQFNPQDGTTIKSFKAPATDPRGLTFDGEYLWISDRTRDEIYMVSPEDGSVIIITEAPGEFTRGLAFFDKNLWAVDSQEDELFQLTVRDGEKYRRSKPHHGKVTMTHQITNFGPGKIKESGIHFAIPTNRNNQELEKEVAYNEDYDEIVTDDWGQQTALFEDKNIEPGKTISYEMTAEATLYDVRWFIYPDEVGGLDEIPEDIKNKYLENDEKYQYDHPIIRTAIDKALDDDEKNPYWMARDLFNYLIDNMYYEMVGGWNTAPAVLERGNGSCSEYSFVYISMCRAIGIPARYVGSLVIRGDDASMDDVYHRWVEVYLPNYGWVPIDPSGGDKKLPRDQANYIGHLGNRFLITTQSGGGSETMEWTYNSNDFWVTEPKTYVVSDHFADWEPLE